MLPDRFKEVKKTNRVCVVCKQNKPVSDFTGDSKKCKSCVKTAKEQEKKRRIAIEQAEQERIERAEKERIAREKAERERIAREKAEKERIAREKAERDCPYVDLGLPSGTLWAKCNVGASKPEEYGDYFAWGDTKGYKCGTKTFNWDSYKWYAGKKDGVEQIKKYCIRFYGNPDGKSALDLEDDAAYMNLGNNWCIPSKEQFEELIKLCTWSLSNLNGVKGYWVKGKNGKSIFLPSAGVATPTSQEWYCVGFDGYYWSKTLALNELCAYMLFFRYFNRDIIEVQYEGREYGMPIRPVIRKNTY